MAGRNRNNDMYQRPEAIDPGFVDVTPLKLFSPEVAGMDAQNLGQSQQRYDNSQTAIAKYIEDIGATPMREVDRENIYNKLQGDLDNIHKQVGKGGGDYGDYLPEIVKSLSKARGTLHLASQDYEKESALRKQYDAQVVSGQHPQKFININDKPVAVNMTFEEFAGGKAFNNEGQYQGYNPTSIRGRGDHAKWTMENISNPIMKGISEGKLGNAGYGYLQSIMTGGMSDDQVEDLFNTEHGKDYVNSFLTNSTFASEEFKNDDGSINVPLAKEYLKDLVKVQTSEILKKTYMQNPDEIEKIKKRNEQPEAPYIPPATFTSQGLVDEISQKAVKEAEEIKTTLGKEEAVRKKINIIKDNNLSVFEEIPTPEWENPVKPEFPELEARWKAGKASYADAASLGAKRMAQAAIYVAGLVERSANWVANTSEAGEQKRNLRKTIYSDFGQLHDGKYTTPSPETMDKDKMSKYLELLWDKKDEYNLIRGEDGLIKIDDAKPSGTQRGSDAEVNSRYTKAAYNVSKILNEGLDNMGKDAKKAYDKIQEYRAKNPIIDILAGRFAEESKNDPFTMYNKAIDQMINTKKDQELYFSKTTPLSKIDASGDNIVKNNIKTRIIQMNPAGVGLKFNTDDGLQTIDTKTAGDINEAVVENKLLSTQLDINNFNILLTTDAGTNYKVDIMPLLPNKAKPVVQGIREFIKKGTELDFFQRDEQGNVIKGEDNQPIYEEPTLEVLGMVFKYELNSTGKTVKPILKGSNDGNTWTEVSGEVLTTYVSEYLNETLSNIKY